MVHIYFHFGFCHAFIHPTFAQGFAYRYVLTVCGQLCTLHTRHLPQCAHLGR